FARGAQQLVSGLAPALKVARIQGANVAESLYVPYGAVAIQRRVVNVVLPVDNALLDVWIVIQNIAYQSLPEIKAAAPPAPAVGYQVAYNRVGVLRFQAKYFAIVIGGAVFGAKRQHLARCRRVAGSEIFHATNRTVDG